MCKWVGFGLEIVMGKDRGDRVRDVLGWVWLGFGEKL